MDMRDWEQGDDAFPIENQPLTGDRRTNARIAVIQGLYQSLLLGVENDNFIKEFEDKKGLDGKLFRLVAEEALRQKARYVELISSNFSEGWEWGRVDRVLRAVLWAGCAELTVHEKASNALIINEYVNIAKGFFGAEQVGFVHKFLDLMGVKIRG